MCYIFLESVGLVEFITIGPNPIMAFRITRGPLKAYITLHIYGLWTLQVISKWNHDQKNKLSLLYCTEYSVQCIVQCTVHCTVYCTVHTST